MLQHFLRNLGGSGADLNGAPRLLPQKDPLTLRERAHQSSFRGRGAPHATHGSARETAGLTSCVSKYDLPPIEPSLSPTVSSISKPSQSPLRPVNARSR